MRSLVLELRAHRLRQLLVTSSVAGVFAVLVGARLSPVPGQLFADTAGIPLVYLTPLVVGISVAHWAPVGTWWFEHRPRAGLPRVVLIVAVAAATGPLLLASPAHEVAVVAARNTVMLAGTAVLVRSVGSSSSATAAVLIPSFITWTFGWDAEGDPRSWALLIAPAESLAAAVPALALTVLGLTRRRLRTAARWPGPP